MKIRSCMAIFVLVALVLLVGCSKGSSYDPTPLFERELGVLLSGELFGAQTEVYIELERREVGKERSFFARFLSGSLEGIVVSREEGEVSISLGGLEQRSFYEGGLTLLCDFFCAEEYLLRSLDKSTDTAVFSAGVQGYDLLFTTGEGGVPRRIECDGVLSFEVQEFSLIK